MTTLYEKNYELPKNGSYYLSRAAYIVVTARIKEYPEFVQKIAEIDAKSESDITEDDILNKTAMESYINAVKSGLKWVPEEVRKALWEYAMQKPSVTWQEVAEHHHYSESYLRAKYHIFIYGIAAELGEIF